MATGSARVSIASSSEPGLDKEGTGEIGLQFGEPNPAFQQALEKTLPPAYRTSPEPVQLDPDDPIDSILIEMVKLNRRKRADYGLDGDPTSNFFRTAEIMRAKGYKDWTALTSVEYAMAIKAARVEALRANGRLDETQNESVRDTLLDQAVYSVLALAVYDREHPQASEAI